MYIHIAIFLWGFTGIFGKLITLDYGQLVWYRMLLSSMGIAAYIWFTKKSFSVSKKDFLKLSGIGSIIALHWVLFYAAIKFSNASVTLSVFASLSLFTALLEPLMTEKKFSLVEIILGAIIIFGIWLITKAQEMFLTGIIVALISTFLAALFSVLNKKIIPHIHPETATFYELSGGFLFLCVLLPFYLFAGNFVLQIPESMDIFYLFLLAIFCTTIAFTLSMYALQHLSVYIINLSLNLEPVYTIILAIFILKENKELNAEFYLGAALILVTVFVYSIYQYRARKYAK
ncbi:MAG: EamA family transporter [Bacteroidetes bacterium]|nr:EamA family transporter [Bacteroidota bacterium]